MINGVSVMGTATIDANICPTCTTTGPPASILNFKFTATGMPSNNISFMLSSVTPPDQDDCAEIPLSMQASGSGSLVFGSGPSIPATFKISLTSIDPFAFGYSLSIDAAGVNIMVVIPFISSGSLSITPCPSLGIQTIFLEKKLPFQLLVLIIDPPSGS
jgi:hypothetical protein